MGIIGYILREPTSIGPGTLLGTLPRGTVLAGEVELGITTWVAVQGLGFRVQGLGFRVQGFFLSGLFSLQYESTRKYH